MYDRLGYSGADTEYVCLDHRRSVFVRPFFLECKKLKVNTKVIDRINILLCTITHTKAWIRWISTAFVVFFSNTYRYMIRTFSYIILFLHLHTCLVLAYWHVQFILIFVLMYIFYYIFHVMIIILILYKRISCFIVSFLFKRPQQWLIYVQFLPSLYSFALHTTLCKSNIKTM